MASSSLVAACIILPLILAASIVILVVRFPWSLPVGTGVWSLGWLAATVILVGVSDSWVMVVGVPGLCFICSSAAVGTMVRRLLSDIPVAPRVREADMEPLFQAIQGFAADIDLDTEISSSAGGTPTGVAVRGGVPSQDAVPGVLVSAPVPNFRSPISPLTSNGVGEPTFPESPQERSGVHVLTVQHHRACRTLRKRVRDILPLQDVNILSETDTLYRFLLARHNNVDEAEKMLRHAMHWRVKESINAIAARCVQKYKTPLSEYCKVAIYGVDVDGHPIIWQIPSPKRVEQLIQDHGKEGAAYLNTYIIERVREVAKAINSDRFTVVLNLEETGTSVFYGTTGEVLRAQMKATQLVYPECMRRCIISKPPWVFERLFSLVKGLLDPRVQEKVKVGTRYVAEFVKPENTPVEFGGTATVPWSEIQLTVHPGPEQPLRKAT